MDTKVQKMLSGSLYAVLAVILAFSIILVLPVYRKHRLMQQRVNSMKNDLRTAQEELQTLMKEVHDLEHKSFATEKIAREKYKKCKSDEQIIIYTE